jgi:small nuclear ribonucleoprotein (snRNP)-like protein
MKMKKIITALCVALLVNLVFCLTASAGTGGEKEARFAARVKAEIAKLGTGPEARIKVKLRDGTKLKGHISGVSDGTFSVVEDRTGTITEVPYSAARQLSGRNNLSGKTITAYVILAVILIAAVTVHGD